MSKTLFDVCVCVCVGGGGGGAVLEIIFIDYIMVKCHLCLVILTGHMQECMVILIKRPVNDRDGSEKFLTLTCIQCIDDYCYMQ